MKFYDVIISLGQYCITSTALRRCHLQDKSSIFDWSAGILPEKCGIGGLSGKVDLICNDFENFFNFEDFENRGNNQENDTYNLFIVNNRTGLQYKHDFPADKGFKASFDEVKQKYMRRVERFYHTVAINKKILFVFIARDSNFSNQYLIEQQQKLAQKFPNKIIDFLYIIHSDHLSPKELIEEQLTENVLRCNCNVCHPTNPQYPESWNGNTELYYTYLRSNYTSLATIGWAKGALTEIYDDLKWSNKELIKMSNKIERIESKINTPPVYLE